jgi:hypothetical protein
MAFPSCAVTHRFHDGYSNASDRFLTERFWKI